MQPPPGLMQNDYENLKVQSWSLTNAKCQLALYNILETVKSEIIKEHVSECLKVQIYINIQFKKFIFILCTK